MPAVFPTLSTGTILLSPQRGISAPVEVVTFQDGTEQRWPSAPVLQNWELTVRCNSTDLASVLNFVDTVKGAYDSTWTFGFNGISNTNCVFESDETVLQRKVAANLYEAVLKIRQCRQSLSASTAPSAWPTINGGVITQYPYAESHRWNTITNRMPSGLQYAWSKWVYPKRLWNLAYPAITAAEMNTIVAAFVNLNGPWKEFSLTDPRTGATFAKCRLDSQSIAIRHDTKLLATSVVIAELW